jgi:hypothetical protein
MHAVNTAQRFNPALSTGFEFTTDNRQRHTTQTAINQTTPRQKAGALVEGVFRPSLAA